MKDLSKNYEVNKLKMFNDTSKIFNYKCCENCSNNPKNGGSGICLCTRPSMENPIRAKY